MYVNSVPALISKNVGNTLTNYTTWGGIVLNTTSYTTLQAALVAAQTDGNEEIVIPPGEYTITSALSLSIAANKKMRIVGFGQVVLNSTVPEPVSSSGIFNITGTTTSELVISNITLKHTPAVSGRGNLSGIVIDTFQKVTLDNVKVESTTDEGIKITKATGGMVLNCQSDSNKYLGLGFHGCTDMKVIGGQYNLNGGDNGGTIEGYGVSGVTAHDVPTYTKNFRISVIGVRAIDNVGKGIDFHNCTGIVIDGNYIKGFRYNGISAVNESVSKVVKDVIITNNIIDGAGAVFPIACIAAGGFGDQALEYGTLIIENNIIMNIDFTTSYAILINNPTTGGIPPEKVIIRGNTIENFNSSNGHMIRISSDNVNIPNIIISDNILKATSAIAGITLNAVDRATVSGNFIEITSGSVTYAIYAASTEAIITDNHIFGAATFADSIVGSQTTQIHLSNFFKGVEVREQVSDISIEYKTAMPTTGTYYGGSIVWNLAPSIQGTAGSRYVVNGWRRITTGVGHVLNTDWVEMRTLTGT